MNIIFEIEDNKLDVYKNNEFMFSLYHKQHSLYIRYKKLKEKKNTQDWFLSQYEDITMLKLFKFMDTDIVKMDALLKLNLIREYGFNEEEAIQYIEELKELLEYLMNMYDVLDFLLLKHLLFKEDVKYEFNFNKNYIEYYHYTNQSMNINHKQNQYIIFSYLINKTNNEYSQFTFEAPIIYEKRTNTSQLKKSLFESLEKTMNDNISLNLKPFFEKYYLQEYLKVI